jgi:hypothetical protein
MRPHGIRQVFIRFTNHGGPEDPPEPVQVTRIANAAISLRAKVMMSAPYTAVCIESASLDSDKLHDHCERSVGEHVDSPFASIYCG